MVMDKTDQEFLASLQRLRPATVQDLCAATGVTATAVRQRLLRLQSDGYVIRETVRQERGRPHHVYLLTGEGVRALGDDHAKLASLLWQEIMRIEDPKVRSTVLEGVKTSLIQRFGTPAGESTLVERMDRLCSALSEHGFDLEVEQRDAETAALPILREHHCPYHGVAAGDPSFCDLETSVFSELIGAPVELSACQLDGHPCCEFQVAAGSK